MIALMDTIACIKTTASPSKDPKSLFEDPAEFTEILKDQKHVILLQILHHRKVGDLLGATRASNPSKHVCATFGSLCAHKLIAATVSAANLLSGSLT